MVPTLGQFLVNNVQVVLFEIHCGFFYTNLHELFRQFISWTNWVNSGGFMENCWISCQVMSPPKMLTFRRPCGIKRHGRNRFSWEKNHCVSRNLAKLLSNQHFGVGRYPKNWRRTGTSLNHNVLSTPKNLSHDWFFTILFIL